MIHAILLYALLGYPNNDNYEQVISWNLPFQTYEQCSMFYLQNKQNLHDGVIRHGKSTYKADMFLQEMGCTKVSQPADRSTPAKDTPGARRPLYNGGSKT